MRKFDFPDAHFKKGDVVFDLDMKRFEEQFSQAQFFLDSRIMTDMVKFMPFVTSTFVNETKARSATVAGSGYVFAAAPPYGRFLYEGKVMVGRTGSTWAEAGEKKVLVSQYGGKTNARENLVYTSTFHPAVTDHWYEAAKKMYGKAWIRKAKEKAGGGNG